MIQKRDEAIQARVEQLSVEQMRNLIAGMMRRNPSFVFHVLEESENSNNNYNSSLDEFPHWCTYHNCREMPTMLENVCCKRTPETCVSKLPEFSLLILEPMVLNMANNYRNDFLGLS